MAHNSISQIVLEASRVQLPQAFKVIGRNTYTISTDFISWDSVHNYTLVEIASTFGNKVQNSEMGVVGGVGGVKDIGFKCGNESISAFDFGLLYSIFTAMVMAKVEFGGAFKVFSEKLSRASDYALWLGNDCVVYSPDSNVIITLKNADVERVCNDNKVKVVNFCSREKFDFEINSNSMMLINSKGELFAVLTIPESVKNTYNLNTHKEEIIDDPSTEWDENSGLGELISENDNKSECAKVLDEYRKTAIVDSIISRDDLVVEPEEKYADTSNFFGSVCYTDKNEIAIAVNFRRGLFVYRPLFSGDPEDSKELKVDPNARFPEFFNITEGCARIKRYSETVVERPLTAAQFDVDMCNKIKEAFLNMELPRIPIKAAFGKIVIPEPVLIDELSRGNGESIYCFVPVGVVDDKVICINDADELVIQNPTIWGLSSAFYDVTGVCSNA